MVAGEALQQVSLEPRTKMTGRVVKTTLAGAVIDIGQPLPGVVHISQIQKGAVNKVEDVLREGQAVDVWVRRPGDRVELTMIQPLGYEWADIKPDMVVKGRALRVEAYGAFVDWSRRPSGPLVSRRIRQERRRAEAATGGSRYSKWIGRSGRSN
jgi:ribosomal protein S1